MEEKQDFTVTCAKCGMGKTLSLTIEERVAFTGKRIVLCPSCGKKGAIKAKTDCWLLIKPSPVLS
jgi:hypothetical protein